MNIKIGDHITLDDVEFEVTGDLGSGNGYWLKEVSGDTSYYSLMHRSKQEMEDLEKVGRLKLGRKPNHTPDTKCWHSYKRYNGFTEIYDYCTSCNDKRHINWRDLK